ncbi:marvel domain-containing protein [Paraphoma chrysanthemicola]|nr:marvel domain-containing protein [Paraphoma chrysanthemicola]
MIHKFNILTSSVLRGFQILFAIVLGLSVTLVKDHNDHGGATDFPSAPAILPISTGIGAISLVAAVLSLAIAWTSFLREYIEMLVDVVIVMINIVGGTIIAIKLKGAKCADSSEENRFGKDRTYPYAGGLASIDLLNGGCMKQDGEGGCFNVAKGRWGKLNTRCMQSQADSVFMFHTVVVLFGTIALTFLRLKSDRRY